MASALLQLPVPAIDLSVKDVASSGLKEIPGEFRASWQVKKASTSNSNGQSIPIIDLAGLHGENRSLIIEQIKTASEEWGFFQVVNHGVSPQLLDETFQEHRKFFELPDLEERLKKYSIYSDKEMSQVAKMENETIRYPSNWRDNMVLNYAPNLDTQKWPTEPPNFIEVNLKYNQAVYHLKKELLDALSESLGLQTSLLDDVLGEGQTTNMIYYPPCPEPSYAFGVKPHSDPNSITILVQDEVGGLEVRDKHGEWIQVKPTPNAFIVNVGDQLEIFSNGKYKSVEHRVVPTQDKVRLSIGSFIAPGFTTHVKPHPELTAKQGQLYEGCVYFDYIVRFKTAPVFPTSGHKFIDHLKLPQLPQN